MWLLLLCSFFVLILFSFFVKAKRPIKISQAHSRYRDPLRSAYSLGKIENRNGVALLRYLQIHAPVYLLFIMTVQDAVTPAHRSSCRTRQHAKKTF